MTEPTTTEPVPSTAPWSETTRISPKSWRPAAGAEFAVISPLTGAEAPDARSMAVGGTVSEPSDELKNTSR